MEKIGFKKFEWIDFGRGIAILLVIMIHTGQFFYKSTFLKNIYDTGDKGVQLFFILSSITLFNSFDNRYQLDGGQRNLFFFIRRFFRISFLYYFFIFFYTLFEIAINGVDVVPYWTAISSSLFLNGLIYIYLLI